MLLGLVRNQTMEKGKVSILAWELFVQAHVLASKGFNNGPNSYTSEATLIKVQFYAIINSEGALL